MPSSTPSAATSVIAAGASPNILQSRSPVFCAQWLDDRHFLLGAGGGVRFGMRNVLILIELLPAAPEEEAAEKGKATVSSSSSSSLWRVVDYVDLQDVIPWCCTPVVRFDVGIREEEEETEPAHPSGHRRRPSPLSHKKSHASSSSTPPSGERGKNGESPHSNESTKKKGEEEEENGEEEACRLAARRGDVWAWPVEKQWAARECATMMPHHVYYSSTLPRVKDEEAMQDRRAKNNTNPKKDARDVSEGVGRIRDGELIGFVAVSGVRSFSLISIHQHVVHDASHPTTTRTTTRRRRTYSLHPRAEIALPVEESNPDKKPIALLQQVVVVSHDEGGVWVYALSSLLTASRSVVRDLPPHSATEQEKAEEEKEKDASFRSFPITSSAPLLAQWKVGCRVNDLHANTIDMAVVVKKERRFVVGQAAGRPPPKKECLPSTHHPMAAPPATAPPVPLSSHPSSPLSPSPLTDPFPLVENATEVEAKAEEKEKEEEVVHVVEDAVVHRLEYAVVAAVTHEKQLKVASFRLRHRSGDDEPSGGHPDGIQEDEWGRGGGGGNGVSPSLSRFPPPPPSLLSSMQSFSTRSSMGWQSSSSGVSGRTWGRLGKRLHTKKNKKKQNGSGKEEEMQEQCVLGGVALSLPFIPLRSSLRLVRLFGLQNLHDDIMASAAASASASSMAIWKAFRHVQRQRTTARLRECLPKDLSSTLVSLHSVPPPFPAASTSSSTTTRTTTTGGTTVTTSITTTVVHQPNVLGLLMVAYDTHHNTSYLLEAAVDAYLLPPSHTTDTGVVDSTVPAAGETKTKTKKEKDDQKEQKIPSDDATTRENEGNALASPTADFLPSSSSSSVGEPTAGGNIKHKEEEKEAKEEEEEEGKSTIKAPPSVGVADTSVLPPRNSSRSPTSTTNGSSSKYGTLQLRIRFASSPMKVVDGDAISFISPFSSSSSSFSHFFSARHKKKKKNEDSEKKKFRVLEVERKENINGAPSGMVGSTQSDWGGKSKWLGSEVPSRWMACTVDCRVVRVERFPPNEEADPPLRKVLEEKKPKHIPASRSSANSSSSSSGTSTNASSHTSSSSSSRDGSSTASSSSSSTSSSRDRDNSPHPFVPFRSVDERPSDRAHPHYPVMRHLFPALHENPITCVAVSSRGVVVTTDIAQRVVLTADAGGEEEEVGQARRTAMETERQRSRSRTPTAHFYAEVEKEMASSALFSSSPLAIEQEVYRLFPPTHGKALSRCYRQYVYAMWCRYYRMFLVLWVAFVSVTFYIIVS